MIDVISRLQDWRERGKIMREIRRKQADDAERNRFKIKDDLTYALQALDRDDRRYATQVWQDLSERHPTAARESPLAIELLMRLKRFEEAEAIVQTGRKKHPSDPYFAKRLAEISQSRRDFDIAIERWAFVRKRFPGIVEGFTAGANALLEKDQHQQAEALALQAIKRFPGYIGGPLEYARVAAKQQDWEEALRRWQPIREQFSYFGAYVGSAEALSHLGRYDEAEELLQQARYRFGVNPGPLSEFARVAEAKGDITEAVHRWKAVLDRFPLEMHVYSDASEAFERLGEPVEAEATLRAAIERFPAELRPRLESAKLLHHKRHNFAAAAEAWAALREVFPDNNEAYIAGADALQKAGRAEEADALREEHRLRLKSS